MQHEKKANQLISPSRLDVFTKTPLVNSFVTGHARAFSVAIYRDYLLHSNASGTFSEGSKKTVCDYEEQFYSLIQSIAKNGYRGDPIPVGMRGILNGAHRLAASLVLDVVPAFAIGTDEDQIYDYRFFRRIGLKESFIEASVQEYTKFDTSIRAFLLTDFSPGEFSEFLKQLELQTDVLYASMWPLNGLGIRRTVELAYGHHDWWDNSKYETMVGERFHPDTTVFHAGLVLFKPSSGADVRSLKESLRHHFRNKRFERNIHGTDDNFETTRLSNTLLSQSGRFFLQNSPIGREQEILDELRVLSDSLTDFAVSGSSVLSLFSDYVPNDLDLILPSHSITKNYKEHNASYSECMFTPDDILEDPRLHFKFKGIKFVTLPSWASHRIINLEPKARTQLSKLGQLKFVNQNPSVYSNVSATLRARRYRRSKLIADKLKVITKYLPDKVVAMLRKILSILLT